MTDSTVDLNTILANVERTFALNARRAREVAEDAMAKINKPENVYIKDGFLQAADKAQAEADRWEARRREAANGFFLARPEDLNDPDYISDFGDVLGAASAAGRVVHAESPQADRMQYSPRRLSGRRSPGRSVNL